MNTRSITCFAVLALVAASVEPFGARSSAEWPRFRGPNGSGVADGNTPPVTFGPSDKLLWKTAIPAGHSSPIVWNDHIFLTAVDNGELVTLALRRKDGAVLWRRVAPTATVEAVHAFNNPAAPTPATDGERVYAYFGSYGLLAYDFSGNEIWRHPLSLLPSRNGTATSPIVVNNKVVLQRDGNSTESELLALDARTGTVRWKLPECCSAAAIPRQSSGRTRAEKRSSPSAPAGSWRTRAMASSAGGSAG